MSSSSSSATTSQRRRTCSRNGSRSSLGSAMAAAAAAAAVIVSVSLMPGAQAQTLDSIVGTWSSGYGAVSTGPGFAQPTNFTFTYPDTTGISYSFTEDGHFEEAQYRFISNGTEPHCPQAVVIWQHGNYTINRNQSITLTPIESDGRIQVQDPCAEESNVITYYFEPTLFQGFAISNDLNHQRYMLQLLRFDGALLPRMYLYYYPPNMLPTQQLWTTEAYNQYRANHGADVGAASHSQSFKVATAILAAASALFFTLA